MICPLCKAVLEDFDDSNFGYNIKAYSPYLREKNNWNRNSLEKKKQNYKKKKDDSDYILAIIMIIIPILVYLFSLQIIYNKLIYIFFIQQK